METTPLPILGQLHRDEELARHGWTRRFVAAPPRLQEMSELYRDLGLEVHLEAITREDLAEGCDDCTLALTFFRAVYTRRAP